MPKTEKTTIKEAAGKPDSSLPPVTEGHGTPLTPADAHVPSLDFSNELNSQYLGGV